LISLEAAIRFELMDNGFAGRCLTTWLCRLKKMERETGFEPATSTLARSHSTTELFPLGFTAPAAWEALLKKNCFFFTALSRIPDKWRL
jgi:hypothetical protein